MPTAADSTLVVTGPAFLDHRDSLRRSARYPVTESSSNPTHRRCARSHRASASAGTHSRSARPTRSAAWRPRSLREMPSMGGVTLRPSAPPLPGAQECYPVSAGPSLIRYVTGGRTITVLGTGIPLTNGSLADRGNAALALNLLAARRAIVWLTPGTAALATRWKRPDDPGRPDPAGRVSRRDPAGCSGRCRRRMAGPQARPACRRTAASRGPGSGNRRGSRPPVPVAPLARPRGRSPARRGDRSAGATARARSGRGSSYDRRGGCGALRA